MAVTLRLPFRARIPRPVVFGLLLVGALSTVAWVYPEHRAILLLAIQKLDPERRAVLDRLWAHARVGHEKRLTIAVGDFTQGEKPTQIDFGAWPAIAADHSCSPANMLETVLTSDWIMEVADITAHLGNHIEAASRNASQDKAQQDADRDNAMRNADLQLQRADPEYATRAGGNAVHYPLGRQSTETTPKEYFDTCLAAGAEMNAFGAYAWYHYSALLKAGRFARETLSAEERSALALALLADEAYAIHFLQDLFAAGHAAVTRGSSAVRKGTHDYYNEFGYETALWDGKSVVLVGDVYMRPQDAELAARAVQRSLEQIIDASLGRGIGASLTPREPVPSSADTLDTCKWWTFPGRNYDVALADLFVEVVAITPVPGLAEGYGELPRFRAEIGPFAGIAPAIRLGAISGAFAPEEKTIGAVASLEFSARFGIGLEGVMNKSGDGLAFLDLGLRQDSPSSSSIIDDPTVQQYGNLFAAIPARIAPTARLRIPFWLLPGDILIAAPILLFTSPSTLTRMGVEAANGGLIPWQSRMFTSIGTFQFTLGREIGASFYGYVGAEDRFLIPDYDQGELLLVEIRSIQFDFPILEYRPFRSFATDQTSSLVFKIYAGFDYPTSVSVVLPEGFRAPELRTVWFAGIRLSFDWRHYF